MNVKRIILLGTAAVTLLSVCSCKKDKTDESDYLEGIPAFSLPMYGAPGDSFELSAKGVIHPEKGEIGYCWYTSPSITTRDTTNLFKLVLPDTLCNIDVTCAAFAKGYYNSPTTKTIRIVSSDREKGSLKGISFDEKKDFVFTDPRDGFEYRCTTVGSKDWFKDNLAYRKAGRPLENCDATTDIFGQLYNWDEARGACPEGWRVSTLQDWADAARTASGKEFSANETLSGVAGEFMCEATFNGDEMWEYSPEVKITNALGLCAIPVGIANIGALRDTFDSINEYAAFWTADEKNEEQAYYRYIFCEQNDIMLGSAAKKSFGASVRCVRDHE